MKFFILWPERRLVRREQIKSWYLDAVANGDLDDDADLDPLVLTHREMAERLHQAGIITLSSNPLGERR